MAKPANSPVSVVLPPDVRRQVEREAKKRGLGVSPAVRTLVVERLREISDSAQLTRTELWQRAHAWASWERAERGDNPEVAWADVDRAFDGVPPRRKRR